MSFSVHRYHDISVGHRVFGHESKCAHLHGHNYRIHFTCTPFDGLDSLGRVIDFSVIKDLLCSWLESQWDHKFLVWEKDHDSGDLQVLDPEGVMVVPFNPTAENMARYLVEVVGTQELKRTDVQLVEVTVEETRKCSATYRKPGTNG